MYCKKCGEENTNTAGYCKKCGAELNEKRTEVNSRGVPANNLSHTMPTQNNSNIPPEYQPISMWGYFAYTLLFWIPMIGWIIALVFAFGATSNINVRNFARSFFCTFLILVVLLFMLMLMVAAM